MSPRLDSQRSLGRECGLPFDHEHPPGPMSETASSRRRRVLFGAIILIGLPALTVSLMEGAASLVLLARDVTLLRPLSERRHVEHDTLLGWINQPNVQIADMYGPGKDLRINAQRFRANGPTSVTPPAGRFRIVCAGDSFTLGFGVANDATWCHILQAERPGLETVNMGQAGYGIDQAYLWYRRDGALLEHDALIFAFISEDFRRAALPSYEGYPKPLLGVQDDALYVQNVPVPRPVGARLVARVLAPVRSLRMSELVRRLTLARGGSRGGRAAGWEGEVAAVADRIVRDLGALGEAHGRPVVFVYLPTLWDHRFDDYLRWRSVISGAAADADAHFVDLVEELQSVPPPLVESYFHDYHFSEAGNRWAAETLLRFLDGLPELGSDAGEGSEAGESGPRESTLQSPR